MGKGALARLVDDLAHRPPGHRLVVVSDDTVAELYASDLLARLRRRGLIADLITFQSGERYKTRDTKAHLEDRLADLGVGRDGAIVAVGGGVVGDLAGFLAATWHRGIPVVQVPTTLLAMVDASIGGKTAVDHPTGKNLVGAFHSPIAVYADPTVLKTLPPTLRREGLAEVVKAAAVADAPTFRWLEREHAGVRDGRTRVLEEAVVRAVRVKARLVAADPFEQDVRIALNFGHTVAHALEVASKFTLRHGEAVAIGLRVEAGLARHVRGFPARDLDRLNALLDALGLPATPPAGVTVAATLAAARQDKKVRAGRLRIAVPTRIGRMPEPPLATEISEDELRAALTGAC